MEAFDPNEGEWLTYVWRLEMFFMVNNVAKDKKGSQFNHLDGRKDVCFAEEFRNADETRELSFNKIVEIMEQQLRLRTIFITERFNFHKYHHEEG